MFLDENAKVFIGAVSWLVILRAGMFRLWRNLFMGCKTSLWQASSQLVRRFRTGRHFLQMLRR